MNDRNALEYLCARIIIIAASLYGKTRTFDEVDSLKPIFQGFDI